MNDILFAVCVSCFLFLAVDDADTCAGRFCAVEIQKVGIIWFVVMIMRVADQV